MEEIKVKRDRLTVEQREKLKTTAKVIGVMTGAAVFGWAYGRLVGHALNQLILEAQEESTD